MNQNQIETTVEGKIITVGKDNDSDAIVFEIPMGIFKIVCIANIPDSDQETAPVYVRVRMNEEATPVPTFRKSPQRPHHRNNNSQRNNGHERNGHG